MPSLVTRPAELARRRPRSFRRLVAKLLLACGASIVLAEVAFRVLLFAPWAPIAARASSLRDAGRFASPKEELYWKLRHVLHPEEVETVRPERPRRAHPELGWVGSSIDVETLAHRGERRIGARRPVLVFGDSFARCFSQDMRCWEDFLAETPLAGEYAVLNYGVNAYGLDQTVLMMQRVLPRFLERDPVVVLSLLVDDDLDRCDLRLREWPKPCFALAPDGDLTLEPPSPLGLTEYVEEHPLGVVSYAWRYLLHGSGWLGAYDVEAWTASDRLARVRESARRLLAMALGELDASGVEHFVLVFHDLGAQRPGWSDDWREPFLLHELERHGARVVLSRPHLRMAAVEEGRTPESYYLRDVPGHGHLAEDGNRIVFDALVRGLRGSFDDAAALRLAAPDRAELEGQGTRARFARPGSDDPARLTVEIAARGRATLSYDLRASDAHFTAAMSATSGGPIAARILLGGESVITSRLEAGEPPQPIELDVEGRGLLTLELANESSPEPATVVLAEPRIERAPAR